MDCDAEYVTLCLSSNIRSISIIMYSLFCESLNKVQMKLMKLQSYTDFAISLFDFGLMLLAATAPAFIYP